MVPSAYEIARSIGFSGTEADFVNAAKNHQTFFSQLKGNKMDYGQTKLSNASSCACGNCGTSEKALGELNLNHPLLKMLAETTGLNLDAPSSFHPSTQLENIRAGQNYNPANPPGYADGAVAQTELRMLPSLMRGKQAQPVTEDSLLQRGREAMQKTKHTHPSPEGFLEFVTQLFGPEAAAEITANVSEEFGGRLPEPQLPVGAIIPDHLRAILEQSAGLGRGVSIVRDQRFAPEPEVFPIAPEVQRAASDEAIQEYITTKMIPAHLEELAGLLATHKGQDLLRQQRRVITRLQKLMQYQAKPETIRATAIHDEHELSIYKNYIAGQIVARNMTQHDGIARVNNAIESMNARITTQKENTERQIEATRKEKVDRIVDDALECLANDAGTTHLGEGLNYLKGLALRSLPTGSTDAEVSERTGVLLNRLQAIVINKSRMPSPAVGKTHSTLFQPGMGGVTPNMQAGGDTGLYQQPERPFVGRQPGLQLSGHLAPAPVRY